MVAGQHTVSTLQHVAVDVILACTEHFPSPFPASLGNSDGKHFLHEAETEVDMCMSVQTLSLKQFHQGLNLPLLF